MKTYYDPNTEKEFEVQPPRASTIESLEVYRFFDDTGKLIVWTAGQLEIIDCIINRSSQDALQRVQVIAATQYGKSLAVAAGVVIRASVKPEQWAIVAGTAEKARIIMEYVIMLALNNDIIRKQLDPATPLDRLRMKKSVDRLSFRRFGEVRVYSAEATRVSETSKSLMGFGSANVVEDEAALIGDVLQSTVMRMLGGHADNFLMKIGNPFNRGHFFRSWTGEKYHRIFIDYNRALAEGRFTEAFIEEMRGEALFDILYECVFPGAERMDIKGWLPILTEEEIERAMVIEDNPVGDFRLGNDVAGGGRNFSVTVMRAYNLAKKIYKDHEPDTMLFAGQIMAFKKELGVRGEDIFIDQVGIGKGAYDRLRELNDKVNGVSGGAEPVEKSRYTNLRAEMYWRAREWVLRGGKLLKDDDWYELTKVRYKVADSSGKIKIMSKEEMLIQGIDSPDVADAFAMTFATQDIPPSAREQESVYTPPPELDPY